MPPEAYQTIPIQTPLQKHSIKVTLLYAAGAVMTVFIVLAIFLSGHKFSDQAAKLNAMQYEIIRLANIALEEDSASLATLNFASTAKITARSYIDWLGGSAVQVSESLRQEYRNPQADSELEAAAKANQFNERFRQIIGGLIGSLSSELASINIQSLDKPDALIISSMIEDYSLLSEDG